MNWLLELNETNPTAQAIAVIALVCAVGMSLGAIKFRRIGLGTAGVLFAGIFVGAFIQPIDHATLDFVKEFGLVLFVYCIGLQLGPGFFASLRQMGARLNMLAAAVVLLGTVLAVGLGWLLGFDSPAVLGLFSGSTTNTPSLGAAQLTLARMPGLTSEQLSLPALAYAVTYPGAVCGIIGAILILKMAFGVDPLQEEKSYAASQRKNIEPLERRTMVVDNPNLEGLTLDTVPGITETRVVVSRIRSTDEAEVHTATSSTVLHRGDHILAVGNHYGLDQFQRVVGHASNEDLMEAPGAVTYRRVVVTNKEVLGKTIRQLGVEARFGVTITRVTRADLEMTAIPNLRLQFGDVLQVVGSEESIRNSADLLGNSLKALNATHFVPLFAGIVLGIVIGTLPLVVPGLPHPLRLGLAGGPLVVAICVGRLGRIGPLVWHMPINANLAFREFGIALFFASVGLAAGPRFFEIVFSTRGLSWLLAGLCVTTLPIFAVGSFALAVWRMNFVVVTGLLAGSMTDPPALAFATNLCGSESPTVAYAAVFPFTMLMRILSVQIMAAALFT